MSIVNFSYVAAIIFAGPLTDRLGARFVFPIAVGTWSAFTALCELTTAFLPLAFLRAMVGVGESPNIPARISNHQTGVRQDRARFCRQLPVFRHEDRPCRRHSVVSISTQRVRPAFRVLCDWTSWSYLGCSLAPDISRAGGRYGGRSSGSETIQRTMDDLAEGPFRLGNGAWASRLSLRLLRIRQLAPRLSYTAI